MSTLYELTEDYLQLLTMLEEVEDEDVVKDTLEGIEGEIEIKADNYAKIIRTIEGNIDSIDSEIKRLQARKKVMENNIGRLKDSLQNAMIATGKTKFKTELFSFGIQKNGGKAPVIWNVPAEELPDEFCIIKREPNKAAMYDYIDLTGDTRYAYLGERGESLRIK